MGSRAGALKVAAGRIGLTLEAYLKHVQAGLKWCYKCKKWKQKPCFHQDKNRGDGLAAACSGCRSRGGILVSFSGSPNIKARAVEAIRSGIRAGQIPRPESLPCADCGSDAALYHHHHGYSQPHWFDVVALCNPCHGHRHWKREDNSGQT